MADRTMNSITNYSLHDLAAHELRTPLAVILSHIELLKHPKNGTLTPEQLRLLTAIERNSKTLKDLFNFQLSELEANHITN